LAAAVSKEAINDVQKALNVIRSAVPEEDKDTQLATLALLVSTSDAIIQSARKMTDAQPKTKTKKVPIPQTKVVKQQSPQQQPTSKDDNSDKRDTAARKPQPPLTPQQQREQ
jgi:hypothetical protein